MSDRPSRSEQLERSPGFQLLISVGIVFLLLLEIGTHLPADSAAGQKFSKVANEYIRVLGVEQAWGVFAPNPRSTSIQLEARVTFADGRTALWELPHGSAIGANLRYYRWRKWLERVRSDDFPSLHEPTARWIASLYSDEGSPVAKVELIRRFHLDVIVGPQPPYQEVTYFTLDLSAEGDG